MPVAACDRSDAGASRHELDPGGPQPAAVDTLCRQAFRRPLRYLQNRPASSDVHRETQATVRAARLGERSGRFVDAYIQILEVCEIRGEETLDDGRRDRLNPAEPRD